MRPEQTLAWMADGTERLLADQAALSEEALAAPTAGGDSAVSRGRGTGRGGTGG